MVHRVGLTWLKPKPYGPNDMVSRITLGEERKPIPLALHYTAVSTDLVQMKSSPHLCKSSTLGKNTAWHISLALHHIH